jgi:hypothetical protein
MIVFVGGHSRKIGKSSVVAALIRALREARWTALKVSRHRHSDTSAEGVIREQTRADSTDSGRYLQAGAVRSFWVDAEGDELETALPAIRRILRAGENCIVESNSLVAWVRPDLYLVVVDPSVGEWKASARKHLDQADAFIVVDRGLEEGGNLRLPETRPRFLVRPPHYASQDLIEFIARRLTLQAGCGNATSRESIPPFSR